MSTGPSSSPASLARVAREQFVAGLEQQLERLAASIASRMLELVDRSPSTREAHIRRDAMLQFERQRPRWLDKTRRALERAAQPAAEAAPKRPGSLNLELIGDDVVEKKIIASRLAMAIHDKATWELNDLKIRIQELEGGDDFVPDDVLRPETLSLLLIDQWMDSDLPRHSWMLVSDVIQQYVVPAALEGYRRANFDLIHAGVVPDIEVARRVKRGAPATARRGEGVDFSLTDPNAPSTAGGTPSGSGMGGLGTGGPRSGTGGLAHDARGAAPLDPSGAAHAAPFASSGRGALPAGGFGYGTVGAAAHVPAAGGLVGGFETVAPTYADGPAPYAPGSGGQLPAGAVQGGSAGARGESVAGVPHVPGGMGVPRVPVTPNPAAQFPTSASPMPGHEGGAPAAFLAPGLQLPLVAGAQPLHAGASADPHAPTEFPTLLDASAGGGAAGVQAGRAGATAAAGSLGAWAAARDDARTQSAASPLARARQHAQGVIGQLKRMLTERIAGFDAEQTMAPTPALSQALTVQGSHIRTCVQQHGGGGNDSVTAAYDNVVVQQVARELRERTGALKQQAASSGEKAVIEVVALMFQSILAEERIPPAVRVWFARLQMPVLRVALSEPEFFGSLQHPARQLIDRMGSCVLGFDAGSIDGSALEGEIRRVVQLIEQYPDTGRKVFLLAFEEFQKFLARYLTEREQTQRVVTVAQQVEQKETMAVRYTIELRKMLEDMPVREEIRAFLFKIWAEVMAMAAMKNGAQHAETLALKRSASELVWAASAKPNRAERAQVIQGLPGLLQRLRQGMSLLNMEAAAQEQQIKIIGDTLADAFQSKTAAIPAARIEAIAQRLANLEDFVGDDAEVDLPLVAESIELVLGMDASGIEVITDGGTQPNAAMVAWARELQPGTWFSLDHNGHVHQVQYAWRSERGQLHLFASISGRSFLVQAGRLAAYLQAGLVLPAEEEALTVRATRDALAKIDANPERLLA
ncbi:DUF1631 family protein [Ramlibacter sp. AN1015]|uniref:DUF1631 family protein n=1 Tax=Ramlibacter sp. AN1015 TaxID=3133428 RepID=UPI0030C61A94